MKRRIPQRRDGPGNTNDILAFFHCARCLAEMPDGTTPREWVRLEAGWTQRGLQVWCVRHQANIIHVDFEGMKHPANMTRQNDG